MKIPVTLILSLLLVKGIYAQEKKETVSPPIDEFAYSNIVQVENTAKDELHKRARKWAAYNCDVITLDDDEEVVGHGIVFLDKAYLYDIAYTIKVKVKDGQYKYEIVNLRIKSRYYSDNVAIVEYPLRDYWMIGKKSLDNAASEGLKYKVISSLEKAMKTPVDDSW